MHRSGNTAKGNATPAARRGTRRGSARFGLVALVVLAAVARAQGGAPPAVPDTPTNVGRTPRGSEALTRAVEAQRRGELEQAAAHLGLAQSQVSSLSASEREELARLVATNRAAIQSRKQAKDLLDQTESAMRAGQTVQARQLCRRVVTLEQSLAAADRDRLTRLSRGLGVSTTGGAEAHLGRAKLQQARALMAEGKYDAADRLAREASVQTPDYGPREDSPTKVLDDIRKARRAPKVLLAASRAALKDNDLDRADQLARESEKNASRFTFTLSSDSPAKVKKDIQSARTSKNLPPVVATVPEKPVAKTSTPDRPKASGGMFAPVKNLFTRKPEKQEKADKPDVKPARPETVAKLDRPELPRAPKQLGETRQTTYREPAVPPGPPVPIVPETKEEALAWQPAVPAAPGVARRAGSVAADTDRARQLIVAGRKALADGQYEKARQCGEQARALRPDLASWEPTPEKLLADVNSASPRTAVATGAPLPGPAGLPVVRRAPAAAVKKSDVAMGLPEDAPPIRSQQEARDALRDGRNHLAAAKFDAVVVTLMRLRTYREAKYSLFDDTPDKLQADLVKARSKFDKAESLRVMKEARTLYETGEYDKATTLAYRAQQLHGPYSLWDMSDRPNKLLDEIQTARERKDTAAIIARRTKQADQADTIVSDSGKPGDQLPLPMGDVPQQPADLTGGKPAVVQKPAPGAVTATAKAQSVRLFAEADILKDQGKLLEAQDKVRQARALKVSYTADEITPEMAHLELTAMARDRIGILMKQAMDVALYASTDRVRNAQQAEKVLYQARQLAIAFNQDVGPVDQQLRAVAQMQSAGAPGVAAVTGGPPAAGFPALPQDPRTAQPPPGVDAVAYKQGLKLLEESRTELRKGQLSVARRKAEEAYQLGLKPQAEQRLKELDIEMHNQARLGAMHTFDAGMVAFANRDYFRSRDMLTSIKPQLLDPTRIARLREVMSSPEMGTSQTLLGKKIDDQPGKARVTHPGDGIQVAKVDTPTRGSDPAGVVSLSDDGEGDLLIRVKAMQNIRFQEQRDKSHVVMREAADRATREPEAAIEMLQAFIEKLPESQLDSDKIRLIRGPIDNKISRYKLLTAQVEIDRQTAGGGANKVAQIMNDKMSYALKKQKDVAGLMKSFNEYYKQGKYREAEQYARLAQEMDPDNPVVHSAVIVSKTMSRRVEDKTRKNKNESFNYREQQDVGSLGEYVSAHDPLVIDKDRTNISRKRDNLEKYDIGAKKTKAIREIESMLDKPVSLNFNDVPLKDVIKELRATQAINIEPDYKALKDAAISLDRPISVNLDGIALKSALNIVLRQIELTWVIRDEVLQITTPDQAKGKLVTRTYLVTDLVTPIPDHSAPDVYNMQKELERINRIEEGAMGNRTGTASPAQTPGSMSGGTSIGSASGSNGTGPTMPGSNNNQMSVSRSGGRDVLPQQLINLLMGSIQPDSWSGVSGPGTIDYFPLGMTLVINQTPDIQEQIADLLQQLRRLQDLEVAIEVRLISLSDNFFERMGVDFDMKIKTDRATRRFEPDLISFSNGIPLKPAGQIQDFSPSRFLAGITPAQTFTQDLDIPLTFSSFPLGTPPFGLGSAFTGNTTGGTSFGLAFLSDIQLFFFMEAAQGDQRFNVMSSPKLIMFNGQTATLGTGTVNSFVSNVVQGGQGQLFAGPVFLPLVQRQFNGIQITLQPVITGDRRFVRLNAGFQLTNPIAQVPVFPVTLTVNQFLEGGGTQPPLVMTQFIQQPIINTLFVNTTAVVPDGGTVLLGGLKRLSEGRNEFGPPILSKIPYLSRLVKNVGYGRETENILMIVTPRIIINEEEEIIQTGVISSPALVQ